MDRTDNVRVADITLGLDGEPGKLEIGEYSITGFGAVVTTSIPAYHLAVGSPAKIVRFITVPYIPGKTTYTEFHNGLRPLERSYDREPEFNEELVLCES